MLAAASKTLCATLTALSTLLIAVAASAAFEDRTQTPSPTTYPTSGPTTRPLIELLKGEYHGTVVDDDETVACITRFETYRGKITGEYTVRTGKDAYKGTLTDFVLVDQDKLLCRFKWHDKHGDGLLTVQVDADGKHFAGSWGKEIVLDELIWNGERRDARDRSKSGSGSSR